MSDEDFDRAFGGTTARAPFTERIGRADPAAQDEPKVQMAGSGPYRPYGFLPAGNIGETCDVQRWLDGTEIAEGIEFQYRFLMQIGYVGEEEIRLFLPDCIVVIEGRNLRDLRKKLARRQITFVSQYSSHVWTDAPTACEPVIKQINVVRPTQV